MSELKKIKKKAWDSFSKYIRLRDCLKTTGTKEEGVCITCGRRFPFKSLQAGHFISSRCNSVLFEEDLVNAQCSGCNLFLNGNYVMYTIIMIKEHGVNWVEEKQKLKYQTKKYTQQDYIDIEKKYREKYLKLLDDSHLPFD